MYIFHCFQIVVALLNEAAKFTFFITPQSFTMKSLRLDLEIPRHFTEHREGVREVTPPSNGKITLILIVIQSKEKIIALPESDWLSTPVWWLQGLTTLLSNMNADLPAVTVQQVITATDSLITIITRLWSHCPAQHSSPAR